MRRLIATLSVTAALVLSGCGSQDADPTSDDTGQNESETDAGPGVASVTLNRSGGIAGIDETWKVGASDPGHRAVFEAASVDALATAEGGSVGKAPCCDFFQYDLVVRYSDGSTETYRMWDGGSADPAVERLVNAVMKTDPVTPDAQPRT